MTHKTNTTKTRINTTDNTGTVNQKLLDEIKAMSEDPRWKKFISTPGVCKSPR